jgi:hypothetical protein
MKSEECPSTRAQGPKVKRECLIKLVILETGSDLPSLLPTCEVFFGDTIPPSV